MKSLRRTAFRAAGAVSVLAGCALLSLSPTDSPRVVQAQSGPEAEHKVNLDRESVTVKLNDNMTLNDDASTFATAHSLKPAWAIKVANSNPRSPGAGHGVVVVGSGRGKDIYGIDTESGKRLWKTTSEDSGISSIAVEGGSAYYTTWSCTLERVRLSDGGIEFVKWIASTVECAPHAQDELVAAAYTQNGNQVSMHSAKSGKQLWKKSLGAPVVTAPVLHGEHVFTTSTDGSVSKLDATAGDVAWSRKLGAVNAPVPTKWGLLVTTPWDGKEFETAKAAETEEEAAPETRENDTKPDRETVTNPRGEKAAPTLAAAKDRRVVLLRPDEIPAEFEGKMPAGPQANLDYQGIAPGVGEDLVFFAHGGVITAVNPEEGKVAWRVKARGKPGFVQPVAHDGLVILARKDGIVTALEEQSGELVWSYRFEGRTFAAAPCVHANRYFITTTSGELISLPTGVEGVTATPEGENEASTWKNVREAFRKVRKGLGQQKIAGDDAPKAKPVNGNNQPRGQNDGDDAVVRDPNDPTEGLTRKQWERREERRANRPSLNGRTYKKKPYPRD